MNNGNTTEANTMLDTLITFLTACTGFVNIDDAAPAGIPTGCFISFDYGTTQILNPTTTKTVANTREINTTWHRVKISDGALHIEFPTGDVEVFDLAKITNMRNGGPVE